MENHLIKCIVKSFSYSAPCLNKIGYDKIEPSISIPRKFFISAHAQSELIVIPKQDVKFFINGSLNRTTGNWNNDIIFRISQNGTTLLEFKPSLEYNLLSLNKDEEYLFEIKTKNEHGCHTLWNFEYDEVSLNELKLSQNLFDSIQNINLNSDYSVFIQTCLPRQRMALKCVLSLLKQVKKLPQKIIVASLDDIKKNQEVKFPEVVQIWSGKQFWTEKLINPGLSLKAINHIFTGFKNSGNPNMWLKYVAPRLCIEEKVLVLDDDTLFLGNADELINSSENVVFMEDANVFYGERTIDYFNEYYQTNRYCKKRPFLCAGAYKLNKKLNYNSKFIDGLILASKHDTDEQSATGMEVLDSDYKLLLPPKYHHGGFINQNIDFDNLEFIHMQGRACHLRNSINLLERVVKNN